MSWDTELEARLRHTYGADVVTTAKFYSAEQRRRLARLGHAMADGSFPIEDRVDVRNAVHLARTGAQRQHVMRRARALGCMDEIPEDWKRQGASVVPLGEAGFLTELAGKMVLTAPAHAVHRADELPAVMRESYERASAHNPYFMWLAGRFVEADRANRNGQFWAGEDLQFGELSVRHGPLNWLHQSHTVIGTIADNRLVAPEQATREAAGAGDRPFIAALSAVWRWIYPEQAQALRVASDAGRLWYSMECVARQIACHSDGDRVGCGKAFPYLQAMTAPERVCEHLRERTSARRMVDPAFLGGAVILPPVQPGWGGARAEVLHQVSGLAEAVAPPQAAAADYEQLLAAVVDYAGT